MERNSSQFAKNHIHELLDSNTPDSIQKRDLMNDIQRIAEEKPSASFKNKHRAIVPQNNGTSEQKTKDTKTIYTFGYKIPDLNAGPSKHSQL